jgi:hypothetical protein
VHSSSHSSQHTREELEFWPSIAQASVELGLRERLASLHEQVEMTMEGPVPTPRAHLEPRRRDGDSAGRTRATLTRPGR